MRIAIVLAAVFAASSARADVRSLDGRLVSYVDLDKKAQHLHIVKLGRKQVELSTQRIWGETFRTWLDAHTLVQVRVESFKTITYEVEYFVDGIHKEKLTRRGDITTLAGSDGEADVREALTTPTKELWLSMCVQRDDHGACKEPQWVRIDGTAPVISSSAPQDASTFGPHEPMPASNVPAGYDAKRLEDVVWFGDDAWTEHGHQGVQLHVGRDLVTTFINDGDVQLAPAK